MTAPVVAIDAYLAALRRTLRAAGLPPDDYLAEIEDHLLEVAAAAVRRGDDPHAACAAAIGRLGPPLTLAARFHSALEAPMTRYLLPLAIACGLAITWIDTRPTWDDTGITAGLLVLTSAAFGVIAPRMPWRWALAIGAWIPLAAIARHGDLKMLVVLAFPLAGAYAGSVLRRVTSRPVQPH